MIALIVTPHSKNIGETYIFPRLVSQYTGQRAVKPILFNVCGEWDNYDLQQFVVQNPARSIVKLAPDLESISPWWNYRIWLAFVSLSIFIGLPIAIHKLLRTHSDIFIIARMATSAVALSKYMIWNKPHVTFIASMAGVPLMNGYRKYFWKWIYKSFDVVVCPCKSMINYVGSLTGISENEIFVIPNAVLENKTTVGLKEKIKSREFNKPSEHVWKLLFVGRLTKQKGVDLLLNALSKIPYDFHLDIIGEGENIEQLKKLSHELAIDGRVAFLGYKPKPFSKADDYDIFLMPSRWEGPGHTIIEALVAGIPSLVSDCNFGPAETIGYGDYGILFKNENIQSLNLSICEAIENYPDFEVKLLNSISQLEKYEPVSVLHKWEALVEKLR